jgi:hypothetical protein
MQRKLASLVLGALVALAIPASAMGSITPTNQSFEIAPISSLTTQTTLGTSLGTCPMTKISGKTPAVSTEMFEVTATFGTCTSGTTISGSGGKWKVQPFEYGFNLFSTTSEELVLRYSSLPGCKLTASGIVLSALWSNGTTSPAMKSGYHAHSTRGWTWANDGGTCAVSGQKETVSYQTVSGTSPEFTGVTIPATDITSPSTPLIVSK